ncbi:CHAT domain-containing protein [Streptomyces sp. NPDC001604]|uniref:CHAT domain-containing tetratricopeptide repeat protein n=1 Tax=Streptomyces sp. NPDC001604 TaxID=3364593 RepID=UPI00369DF5B8
MRDERLAAVWARLQWIGETHDLSAILELEALREAQELADNHDERDLEVQFTLGWFHLHRYYALPEGADQAALTAAVEAFTPCFAAGIDGLPEPLLPLLADAVAPLAVQMGQYAQFSPDLGQLSAAADLWQRIVQVTPADHPDRPERLSNLGAVLGFRFERTGVVEDVDAAIGHLRQAVDAAPADHPNRIRMLSSLGAGLGARFERTGVVEDVDAAIGHLRQAVDAAPADHPNRPGMLSNLGNVLGARFERTGALEDVDAAIRHLRQAVDATPADHPNRPMRLSNLGNVLRSRFERTGALEDVDAAIRHLRQAVDATPADHSNHGLWLYNLGNALNSRSRWTGALEDVDAAIRHLRQAVDATPADHPNRIERLSGLAGALRVRFERTGSLEDLDTAISYHHQAVDATSADHPNRHRMLSNLGIALSSRFRRTGAMGDVDAAIGHLRQAVATISADHPNRPLILSSLGGVLGARFERTGVVEDVDAAIGHLREAVDTSPADYPNRPVMLSNLGSTLEIRFGRTAALEDLESAIGYHRQAVVATLADHPDRPGMLSNLAAALGARFIRTAALEDVDAAVGHLREAVDATPDEHPERGQFLWNLGDVLHTRFDQAGAPEDLDRAASCWLEASEVDAAAPALRVQAGAAAARLVAQSGDLGRAAEVAEAAVRLLPQVAPRRLERMDQQHALGGVAGLAGTAAALALAAPGGTATSRAERALGLLEAGRAVLLSQALETRSDLTDLSEHHPGLARRFAELRQKLDEPTSTTAATEASIEAEVLELQQDRLVQDRHRLAEEFTALLTEIRNLDGFSSFALPPTTDELLTQASQGPVVVFNISDLRSDALLLTTEGITSLELPRLTPNTVIDQINTFRRALHLAVSGADSSERENAQAALTEILQWLWDAATGPVLEKLGYDGAPAVESEDCEERWPQVWWAPGGLLGLLPLHAAGYHTDAPDDPRQRSVMDRVISSYTPSVRALRYARERAHSPTAARNLIVAMPTTPGLPGHGRLRFVDAEATMLQSRLPNPVLLKEPDPADGPADPSPSLPMKAHVLEHLPQCAIAHFACHGASNPADPSKSQLLLHDHADDPLTVASLAPVMLGQARLAYLSACRTAVIDTAKLLDEAIHLTSAFQLTGFPHVIGTLWEINDDIAFTIADLFYAALQTDSAGLDPDLAAHALHNAVRKVRDGHDLLPGLIDRRQVPLLWAAHLHAGA